MAPKKKEQQQKMSLTDFMADSGFGGGSWADEVEETSVIGTQALPASDRPRMGGGFSSYQDRGYSVRESAPQSFPTKPPYTAHLGNLSYDATNETLGEFFEGCEVASVRIIEDRELMRPKGFGYVEFATADGLKKALELDGQTFQSRMIKIKIADPPRQGEGARQDGRDMDWTRKGPLADAGPSRGARQPSDFGERRPRDPEAEARPPRDLNWGERRGPLAPLAQEPATGGFRGSSRPRPEAEGMGERSESYRGGRPAASWGEGRPAGEERPARREFTERPERPERPERTATAADQDMKWRERMRPDAPAETPSPSGDASAPASPALSNAAPASSGGRPKLNLAKRTVSEAPDVASPSATSDSKASPFGAARPIDTRTREKEVEERRQQAIREKKEADDKAKEERRLAKEAAAAKAAEDAEAEAAKAAEAPAGDETKSAEEDKENNAGAAPAEAQNGEAKEQKLASRPREPKEGAPAPKSRANEAGNWRSASFEGGRGGRGGAGPRGGRGGAGRGGRGDGPRGDRGDRPERGEGRGPRSNGPPSQPATPLTEEPPTPTVDEDGWTTVTVPKKGRTVRS